jgi:hypothetical protein
VLDNNLAATEGNWRVKAQSIHTSRLQRRAASRPFPETASDDALRARKPPFVGPPSNWQVRPKPDLHDLASGWSDRLKPAIRIGLTPAAIAGPIHEEDPASAARITTAIGPLHLASNRRPVGERLSVDDAAACPLRGSDA